MATPHYEWMIKFDLVEISRYVALLPGFIVERYMDGVLYSRFM